MGDITLTVLNEVMREEALSVDTYERLLRQREELEEQIKRARELHHQTALDKIIALMREFGINLREVQEEWSKVSDGRKRRRPQPRYWNPDTGATWSGRGKMPRWMAGRNPEEFRIARWEMSESEQAQENTSNLSSNNELGEQRK